MKDSVQPSLCSRVTAFYTAWSLVFTSWARVCDVSSRVVMIGRYVRDANEKAMQDGSGSQKQPFKT